MEKAETDHRNVDTIDSMTDKRPSAGEGLLGFYAIEAICPPVTPQYAAVQAERAGRLIGCAEKKFDALGLLPVLDLTPTL